MADWGATQAKAKFSEVLDRAEAEGPQVVRRRKREFFVLTREQWDALGSEASSLVDGAAIELQPVREAPQRAARDVHDKKPFVSAWDALAPSFDERFDVDFPRLKGKLRKADLG